MRQDVISLYDQYIHGGMSRRSFLDRLSQTVGGTAAAFALLPSLENDYAQAPIVPADDKSLESGRAGYDAAGTKMSGYLVRQKGGRKRPAVIVVHENRGLNPHIEDVARRLATEGFLAFAVDALSPLGGTPANEEEAIKLIGSLKAPETLAHYVAAVTFLASHAESTGKVGVVGFCWGGGMVNRLAAAGTAALAAGVAYYGSQLPAAEVPNISCPLMLHYASLDERIDAGIPDYEAALKANKKTYELFMYAGANHAFNNNTNAARYNKEAADLAWERTLAFFKEQLGAPPRAA
jgi:carboxymethylenebutenolidase